MSSFDEHLKQELSDPEMATEFLLDTIEEYGANSAYTKSTIDYLTENYGISYSTEITGRAVSRILKSGGTTDG